MEHFRTGRLTARDWVAADLEGAFAIWSRVEVTRWVFPPSRPAVTSLAQMKQMLDQRIARNRENPAYGMWAVELQASGLVIGAVLLRPLRPGTDVEIGWHFNPDYWGAGYATEAARGVVALAFGLDQVGPEQVEPDPACRRVRPVLDRVQALVDPGNSRSQDVCRRLGMSHLGQTVLDGTAVELFELTRTGVHSGDSGAEPMRC